jgi:hypothetical protein
MPSIVYWDAENSVYVNPMGVPLDADIVEGHGLNPGLTDAPEAGIPEWMPSSAQRNLIHQPATIWRYTTDAADEVIEFRWDRSTVVTVTILTVEPDGLLRYTDARDQFVVPDGTNTEQDMEQAITLYVQDHPFIGITL